MDNSKQCKYCDFRNILIHFANNILVISKESPDDYLLKRNYHLDQLIKAISIITGEDYPKPNNLKSV